MPENAETDTLSHAGILLNIKAHECRLHQEPIVLTPTEFTILQVLLENAGNVISAEQLFHRIWKDEYYSKRNNTITVHIRHLREKLHDSVDRPKYIKTIWEWDIKLKNKNTSDYTRMQVKAFLQLFGVAAYVSLIFIVILVMRGYGLGANSLLYFGIILFLFCLCCS